MVFHKTQAPHPEERPLKRRGCVSKDVARSDRLAQARRSVARIERQDRGASLTGPVLPSGIAAVDAVLPRNGLAFGGIHEVLGLGARRFAAQLLRQRFTRTEAPALWLVPAAAGYSLYGPGLVTQGVDPNRIVLTRVRSVKEGLWCLEEALKSGAFALVLAELDSAIGQTAARRLQLAAEAGASFGLLISEGCTALSAPGSVTSRWRAEPLPSTLPDGAVQPRLSLSLERHRGMAGESIHWAVDLG